MHIRISTQTRSGPNVPFLCPRCNQDVDANSTESIERAKLYGIIPIAKFRNSLVTCPACKITLHLALPIDRLATLPPEARGALIVYQPPKAAKFLAIIAACIFWVPVLGLIVAAIAAFLTRGTKGWPKTLAFLSLVASAAITICVIILAFMR